MRFSSKIILSTFIGLALLYSCEETVNIPKPRGYPRVILPEQAYQKFAENYCQFTFNYSKTATIEQDKLFFDEKAPSDCWFNVNMKGLNATIYCSYYRLDAANTLEKLRTDAFQLVGKHNIKADYIDEISIQNTNKVSGFIFDIQGPAACPFQFYLTDSSKHFLRGALYINAEAKPDSLKPVVDFMKKEIMEMINTFEWRG